LVQSGKTTGRQVPLLAGIDDRDQLTFGLQGKFKSVGKPTAVGEPRGPGSKAPRSPSGSR
jgi:hypothetical protein